MERVLPDLVALLATQDPTLLLVLDGMSAGVATEIIAHAKSELEFGIVECLLPGSTARSPAVAVLPSLTEMCPASHLASGQQDVRRRTFASREPQLVCACISPSPLDRLACG